MKASGKVAVALVFVAAGSALAFVGAAPEAYRGVGDVARDPADFGGREILVKAVVAPGSVDRAGDAIVFRLEEPDASLPVRWAGARPIPEHEAGGTIEGRTVVVRGTLTLVDGAWTLVATDMQVGCASKYEAAR